MSKDRAIQPVIVVTKEIDDKNQVSLSINKYNHLNIGTNPCYSLEDVTFLLNEINDKNQLLDKQEKEITDLKAKVSIIELMREKHNKILIDLEKCKDYVKQKRKYTVTEDENNIKITLLNTEPEPEKQKLDLSRSKKALEELENLYIQPIKLNPVFGLKDFLNSLNEAKNKE